MAKRLGREQSGVHAPAQAIAPHVSKVTSQSPAATGRLTIGHQPFSLKCSYIDVSHFITITFDILLVTHSHKSHTDSTMNLSLEIAVDFENTIDDKVPCDEYDRQVRK